MGGEDLEQFGMNPNEKTIKLPISVAMLDAVVNL